MSARGLDLRALARSDQGWRSMALPDSAPAVALRRMHLDASSRATVSLVRFPPGWRRPGTGHYGVGEEFVLLSGDLTVSGVRYGAGDWAWLPPGVARSASESVAGALALALFTGVPTWSRTQPVDAGPPSLTQHVATPSVLRPDAGRGWTEVVATAPSRADSTAIDVLWPASATWAFAAPGESLPRHPGPAVVRHWPAPSA